MVLLCNHAAAERTLIHAGRLIDVTAGEVREARTVVVEADRVVGVEDGYTQPGSGDAVVDLTTATVMPGWIDMHVHIASEQSPRRQVEAFTLDPADHAYRSVAYAERTLMAGFTTVRDLGTVDGLAQSLRDAIAQGWVVGPRIITAGKGIASTGGHGDPSNGRNRDLAWDPGPADGVVNSEADAYKAVRARYKEGSDLIKITGDRRCTESGEERPEPAVHHRRGRGDRGGGKRLRLQGRRARPRHGKACAAPYSAAWIPSSTAPTCPMR